MKIKSWPAACRCRYYDMRSTIHPTCYGGVRLELLPHVIFTFAFASVARHRLCHGKSFGGASDGFVDLRCDVCLRRFAGAYVRLALSSLPTASVHSRVNGMLCMDNSLRPGGTRIRREVCSPFSKLISRVCDWCVGIRRCQSKLAEQLRAADFLCGFFGVVVRFWA